MISLSELHTDALCEIFNIGAGRAASSLSEIIGEEVQLSVPHVQIFPSSEIQAQKLPLDSARVGAVRQHFSGPFDAIAMLLFTEERALEIVRDMMGSHVSLAELAEFEQDAMCELGNIILNACLSAMADLLGLTLQSTLPQYTVDSPETLLQNITGEIDQPVMMALHIDLTIEKRQTQGCLVFLLSTSSLKEFLSHIDAFITGI
ncbi:MAG: chemotaxis protein CheX [Gallionella sp.]